MTVALRSDDGVVLGGDLWLAHSERVGQVIINPATGVLARFYHRYARFLARHGFEVLSVVQALQEIGRIGCEDTSSIRYGRNLEVLPRVQELRNAEVVGGANPLCGHDAGIGLG